MGLALLLLIACGNDFASIYLILGLGRRLVPSYDFINQLVCLINILIKGCLYVTGHDLNELFLL